MDRKRKRAEWKRGAKKGQKEEESGVEERSKEWIEKGRERSGREEQRMDRKRKRAEWKRGAKNG